MSKQWRVVGRVLPERASVQFSRVSMGLKIGDSELKAQLQIDFGHATVALEADREISLYEALDAFRQLISIFANYISVQNRGAYAVMPDVAFDDAGVQHPCPVFEPIFEPPREGFTFAPIEIYGAQIAIPTIVAEPSVKAALHSLTQSMRFSDFSFMYCRLAIEAVRSHFDPDAKRGTSWSQIEAAGEQAMCSALKINRSRLNDFRTRAAQSRHGKQVINSDWETRKSALELSWEIVNRHILCLSGSDVTLWNIIE